MTNEEAIEELTALVIDATSEDQGARKRLIAKRWSPELTAGLAHAYRTSGEYVDQGFLELEAVPGLSATAQRLARAVATKFKTIPKLVTAHAPAAPDDDVCAPESYVLNHLDMAYLKDGGWRTQPHLRNAIVILEQDSRWLGRIRRNTFTESIDIDGRPIEDVDEINVVRWMSDHYKMNITPGMVHDAAKAIAKANEYNPVRDYLNRLEWDGTPRVSSLMHRYFGAAGSELDQRLSTCAMIAGVARIMAPGCKVDTMPILVGGQGAGKSTAIRTLAKHSRWFSDSTIDIRSKEAYQSIQGVWLYEMPELDSLNRRDAANTKAFLTSPSDKYRPPYGRHDIRVERQVCFWGTTNHKTFLSDETGSRRFWPVMCGVVDVPSLTRDVDQLWAEAVAMYKAGSIWWLSKEESAALALEACEYRDPDVWEAPIAEWAHGQTKWHSSADILEQALDIKKDKLSRMDGIRLKTVLMSLKWEHQRKKVKDGYESVRVSGWVPPQSQSTDD